MSTAQTRDALEDLCDRLDRQNTVTAPQACADTMDEARAAILSLQSDLTEARALAQRAGEERDRAVAALKEIASLADVWAQTEGADARMPFELREAIQVARSVIEPTEGEDAR